MAKRDTQARCWTFTINNYTEDEFKQVMKIDCQYMVVGREVGEKGTPHLQGYIQLVTKKRFKQVKRLIGRGHIEKARGNAQENKKYCSKGGDVFEKGDMKIEGKKYLTDIVKDAVKGKTETELNEEYGDMYIRNKRKILDVAKGIRYDSKYKRFKQDYEGVELREWQKEVLTMIENQNNRQILFVIDEKGNAGKTFLKNYMKVKYERECKIFGNGRSADIRHGYNGEDYVCFDFARTTMEVLNYEAIEDIKNGTFFSTKYDSCDKVFPPPKMVCFMNQKPNETAMSEDRYVYYYIDN